MLQQLIVTEPRVTLSGGGGTGAQVRAKVSRGRITQFLIVNPEVVTLLHSNDYYRSQRNY